MQAGAVTGLGVEDLAGGEGFVLLNEVENVERHLVVAATRNIRERIIYGCRHDVDVFRNTEEELTMNAVRTSYPGTFSMELRLRSVGNRKIHNLLRFSAKLWTLWCQRKDSQILHYKSSLAFLKEGTL